MPRRMAIGSLVTVVELQSEGLARLIAVRGGFSVIRFLVSGAEMTQESRLVLRYALLPGTRVDVRQGQLDFSGAITGRRLGSDRATGLLVYGVQRDGAAEVQVREDQFVAVRVPEDPVEQLALAHFNDLRPVYAKAGSQLPSEPWGPQTTAAREQLLAWRDAAWGSTAGVVGLAAARIRALPHQMLAARRALDDRQVRFLLADEVGLGKTIEAGLIVQSLLAIKPGLRVLVIVPGALISQWFLELHVRFGGQSFLMLDHERLRTYSGNPWEAEQFVLASSRAVEELTGKHALRLATSKWDVVVVDECHRMQPGGALFNRVAVLSKASPHVLLLSATPARQHPDAYLALLHLLQPQVWRLEDRESFAARLAAHDEVVALLSRTLQAQGRDLTVAAAEWQRLIPGDEELCRRAAAVEAAPEALPALLGYVREHLQLDRRIIRNRRQVLARLSQETGIQAFAPTTRSREVMAYTPDAPEAAVRKAHASYRAALVKAAGGRIHPRLAHWLLQVELALAAHPVVLERMLAMRGAVVADPDGFEEYRIQARPGETMAQVLRSDLSENEIASHVAVSAACNVDPAVESAPLAALREAVAAWAGAKGGKGTARLRALVKRLEAFWKERPQEKVLVFTTHGLAVPPLAEAFEKAFGEGSVETFGAHQDTIAREESARRFQQDDRCPLLVCDPLGGEGRNFQFVSLVVHHDLPWSLAAVEQRIGRVDRLGRDGDIPSLVVVPEDPAAVDAAWAGLLDEAVGVFTSSSSGLEFIHDAIECAALEAALQGGGARLRGTVAAAAARVRGERDARDRLVDECFHADAAAYAAAGRDSAAVESATAPEGAVARWIRGMGGEAWREEERPRAWRLRTRHLDQPVTGVFDRAAALAHPQHAFLGIGHRLIDRLVDDATAAAWCRASAWRRTVPAGLAAWSGVRAVLVLQPDLAPIAAAGLRLEVLRRLFLAQSPVRVVICAGMDGVEVADPALAAALREPFSAKGGDASISVGVNRAFWTRPLLAGQAATVVDWQAGVRRASAAVLSAAARRLPGDRAAMRAVLDARLQPGLDAARATAAALTARLGPQHADARQAQAEAAEEERQVAALRAAVDGAVFAIDGIAQVSLG